MSRKKSRDPMAIFAIRNCCCHIGCDEKVERFDRKFLQNIDQTLHLLVKLDKSNLFRVETEKI